MFTNNPPAGAAAAGAAARGALGTPAGLPLLPAPAAGIPGCAATTACPNN